MTHGEIEAAIDILFFDIFEKLEYRIEKVTVDKSVKAVTFVTF